MAARTAAPPTAEFGPRKERPREASAQTEADPAAAEAERSKGEGATQPVRRAPFALRIQEFVKACVS